MTLRIGGLFEGCGGLTMGVQAALGGGDLVWYSEYEPPTEKQPRPSQAGARLLAHRHPGVPNLGDITTVDWAAVEPVDVLCGGFPCQDVSFAGQRAGFAAGSRSGLWWRFADAIRVLQPSLVVIENVPGLLTARGADPTDELLATDAEVARCKRVLRLIDGKLRKAEREGKGFYVSKQQAGRVRVLVQQRRAMAAQRRAERRIVRAVGAVLGSLADLGFDAEWCGLSAADVGACHKRLRIFILAWPAADTSSTRRDRGQGRNTEPVTGSQCPGRPDPDGRSERASAADAERGGRRRWPPEPVGKQVGRAATTGDCEDSAAHAECGAGQGDGHAVEGDGSQADGGRQSVPGRCGGAAADADGDGRPWVRREQPKQCDVDRCGGTDRDGHSTEPPAPTHTDGGQLRFEPVTEPGRGGPAEPANAVQWGEYGPAVRRWERVLGRFAPVPVEPNTAGGQRLAPRFVEWMQGLPEGHVTDPALGLTRNEQLRLLGNTVVPQQAEAATRLCLRRAAQTIDLLVGVG